MNRTEALEQVCALRPRLAAVEASAEHESHLNPPLDLEVDAIVTENRVAQDPENIGNSYN